MKILLYSGTLQTCPPEGYGAEVATWDLAEALVKLGHEVLLAAPRGSKTPGRGALVEVSKTTPDQVGPNWLEVEWLESLRIVEEWAREVDVVHDLSCSVSLHHAACTGRRVDPSWTGSPAVCATPHLYTQNGIAWYEPRSSRHNVVVVSEAAYKLAREGRDEWAGTTLEGARHPPLDAARIVRYGCDTEFYRPSLEAPDSKLIAYVGRPHPHKGLLYITEVAKLRPDLQFVCAWRAATREQRLYDGDFRKLVGASALHNVEVLDLPTDPIDHHRMKRDLVAQASVFLHPAIYVDACPRGVIEAQACGTPVVAFRRGGAPELTFSGRTSVLVPAPREVPAAIPDATRALAAALDVAAGLDRAKVREWALATLTRERMAEDYVNLYKRVLCGARW